MTLIRFIVFCAVGLGIYGIGRWRKDRDLMVVGRVTIITTVLITIFPR